MQLSRKLIFWVLILVLSGCQQLNTGISNMMVTDEQAYSSNRDLPPLKVPEHLNEMKVKPRFVIPEVANDNFKETPSLYPPDSPSLNMKLINKK